MPALALALLAVLAAGPAHATQKCVGADGKVTYSDRGCAAGAKRTAVGVDTSLSDATIEYYDVPAPGGHRGRADWHVSYTYRQKSLGDGRCAVESVSTKLDLKVRLPRWNPPADAPAALVGKWGRYMDALRVHEAGHLQTGRDLASNFKAAALGMGPTDCGALGAAVRARFDGLLGQANARDRDYDAQTRHGATQGAYFQ
jgi:predicted secreted Zn-dependent protease